MKEQEKPLTRPVRSKEGYIVGKETVHTTTPSWWQLEDLKNLSEILSKHYERK